MFGLGFDLCWFGSGFGHGSLAGLGFFGVWVGLIGDEVFVLVGVGVTALLITKLST